MNNSSQKLISFWRHSLQKAVSNRLKVKDLILPLARIKRLMKVEEDVRMVASEVPIIFSLLAELFVEELTVRAWIHTDESRRRILQKSDINAAIKSSQMYDFLIHVVSSNANFDNLNFSQGRSFDNDLSTNQIFLEPSVKGLNYRSYI